jgi:deoxycytidylate deaminase
MSIYSDKEIRRNNRGAFSEIRDNRDSGSKKRVFEIFKQDVSKCVYLSDISINNELSLESFYQKLLKYYSLILQPGCITPSSYELFMNEAYALSLKSSCISRQVGAVIIGKNGYVVGAGWNDAGEGQVGCGYRQIQDIKNLTNDVLVTNPATETEFRTIIQEKKEPHEPFCYKDEYSKFALSKKIKSFMESHDSDFADIDPKMKKSFEELLIGDITVKRLEYCRALHAEENALLQSSKIGGVGVGGGTIFTTSFPCELCAKKIYQSGITEIVYTEPYPDSISQNVILKDGIKSIKLTQFEGVKSHSYFRMYKSNMDKKEMIEMCKREKDAEPAEPSLFD